VAAHPDREPPTPARVDVVVVGAGPAGVAAAVAAHSAGLVTLAVDKARFPRDKTCGDGLTTAALRALDGLGLDVRRLPSYAPVHETVIVGPDGREIVLPLPADGAYAGVVPRRELDRALVLLARDRGVDVRDHTAVVDMHAGDESVTVFFGDGTTVRARWVIAADGHYSPTRRLLSSGARGGPSAGAADLGTWHAFRQYFRGVADRRLWVLFDADLLPGYAWVFPVGDDRANVGFGVLRATRHAAVHGKELARLWRDVVARPHVRRILGARAEPEGPARAWPIPAVWDEAALSGPPRVLYAGDAAGVVDPMTGEGIAQALDTGALAARAVAFGGHPANVAAQYCAAARNTLGRDLRFAATLQRVLGTTAGARLSLRAAGLTPWTRRNFARWMFEDYPRALVLTPDRWQRGMFTRPGAYLAAR
jgi:geranylgeranyl reductase family protein